MGAMRKLDAVHDRHADIRQKEVKGAFGELFETFRTIGGFMRLVTVEAERPGHEGAQGVFVFGDEDSRHG